MLHKDRKAFLELSGCLLRRSESNRWAWYFPAHYLQGSTLEWTWERDFPCVIVELNERYRIFMSYSNKYYLTKLAYRKLLELNGYMNETC